MTDLDEHSRPSPGGLGAESERLAALGSFGILDTPPDARLDAFTRLAARALNTPMAMISLIDESRQWIKSASGLTIRETPRDWAFCDHTIRVDHGEMAVGDAALDSRFRDNPLVVGPPFIRAYAGTSLADEAGYRLGALCVLDDKPRTFSGYELEALRDLASGVSAALLNHRSSLLLQRAATTDPLTGLANRAIFMAHLSRSVMGVRDRERRRASVPGGARTAILVLDLERFKAVHDLFGYLGGEAVLMETARRLASAVRANDLLAHFGGDTFAVMLTDVADEIAAVIVAERLLASLADPYDVDTYPVVIRGSVGVALAGSPSDSAEELVANADAALWRAKRGEGGRICCYTPEIARQQQERRGLELDLRGAIKRGELLLHFQPILSATAGSLIGHEALVRWQRPGHGLQWPDEFLPCAESCGLMPQVDRWVIGEACRIAAASGEDTRVAVNISPSSLLDPGLAAHVQSTLASTGLHPERLEIELTERSPVRNVDLAAAELGKLKAAGCRLVLDDFGAGHSSLRTLRVLPFDKIKLDREILLGLGEDDGTTASMLTALVKMGHQLGVTVCAEGVETELQWAVLRRLQCDEVQGFLPGRPAPKMSNPMKDSASRAVR